MTYLNFCNAQKLLIISGTKLPVNQPIESLLFIEIVLLGLNFLGAPPFPLQGLFSESLWFFNLLCFVKSVKILSSIILYSFQSISSNKVTR